MLRGLQQMDCVSFFIWVRRVKIRMTFTCRQIALEKSSNIIEAFEQREFRFRPLEIWVSELNFYFFLISKRSLRSLQAEFKDACLSEKCRAPVCFYTRATSISSAGATCASLSVRSVRSSGGRRTASARLHRRAQPDVPITVFAKEQKGPGPAAAKDATPHPRSQPGPPRPRETTAISTTTFGERQAVGTEGATVPRPAPPPPRRWRWRYAPWLCPYLVRLSQSQFFSLGMCHFPWLFRCYVACICVCLLLFQRAVRDTRRSLTRGTEAGRTQVSNAMVSPTVWTGWTSDEFTGGWWGSPSWHPAPDTLGRLGLWSQCPIYHHPRQLHHGISATRAHPSLGSAWGGGSRGRGLCRWTRCPLCGAAGGGYLPLREQRSSSAPRAALAPASAPRLLGWAWSPLLRTVPAEAVKSTWAAQKAQREGEGTQQSWMLEGNGGN